MIVKYFCVSCDECGIRAPFEGSRAGTTLERNVREYGWSCDGEGKDRCPDCLEEKRTEAITLLGRAHATGGPDEIEEAKKRLRTMSRSG